MRPNLLTQLTDAAQPAESDKLAGNPPTSSAKPSPLPSIKQATPSAK